jgi:hypothetical protein
MDSLDKEVKQVYKDLKDKQDLLAHLGPVDL